MLDKKLRAIAIVLRSFTDIICIVHMILQFRTGFINNASRKLGKPVLITDASAIAKRYLWPYFLIDILVILPIPQVCKELFSLLKCYVHIHNDSYL
jgi:cyclic nucleotide gated channel